MSSFTPRSIKRLEECDPKLQQIMNELIKVIDVTILCGYRDEDSQNEAFNSGNSKLKFPDSKHNQVPSLAVDVCPYPIDFTDIPSFEKMCIEIEKIAEKLEIKVRMGRDFSFKDFPHVELV